MLRAMEAGRDNRLRAVQAKSAIAELAESVLRRICRILGGGTFSRSSPFGYGTRMYERSAFCARPGAYPMTNLLLLDEPYCNPIDGLSLGSNSVDGNFTLHLRKSRVGQDDIGSRIGGASRGSPVL